MGSRLEALNLAHIAAMNNLRSATSTNDQLVAECAAIKLMNDCLSEELRKYESDGAFEGPLMHLLWWKAETSTTDRFLVEQRAQARIEGVNFAASRVAAAFNHGFIDKPMAEVYDVVKAVLGAKEELATAPEDGLSGEYAEQALKDWAAQMRNEVNHG